ncbi:ATP-binding protein [Oricola nitratireducens]|uniref:ATP-binding protein n=1 Tax=Oricola nitratireducens TaxID=2775868 RepID=UPI001867CB19|nr:ATP-binding protein [Oricola nitratireducens]
MSLKNAVSIARRFQRSIRIDTDFDKPEALEGFICPQSSVEILRSMARNVREVGQSAFTWTGPYGSGKSSLVVALSALLSSSAATRKAAAKAVGADAAREIWRAMPPGEAGWDVIPVVGRRDNPVNVLAEAFQRSLKSTRTPKGGWDEGSLVSFIERKAQAYAPGEGGVIIFIDEMGKFLEAAGQSQGDIYIFQQLAEAACRSDGRLVLVGILHQAFDEYANKLSREARDEWSKIQGRFVDLPVNVAGEEQIELISQAIVAQPKTKNHIALSKTVGAHITRRRKGTSKNIDKVLADCWPLHPVTAALLGPLSRRRFGQNQRSIFGFLNSAEPHGFSDFLDNADSKALYQPDALWDYLKSNLEPSIMASPDVHRWALGAEAVERCEALGGEAIHLGLLKTIAVVDLLKDRSGIAPSFEILAASLPSFGETELNEALDQLAAWSLVIYKKHAGAYAIFAGSDFDIDSALEEVLVGKQAVDIAALKNLADLHPILAKRHFHKTGTMRWFDIDIATLSSLKACVRDFSPTNGTIGQFLLVIPDAGEDQKEAEAKCQAASKLSVDAEVIIGLSHHAWNITSLARELIAYEQLQADRTELQGDAVARREIQVRVANLQSALNAELQRAFDNALWFQKGFAKPRRLMWDEVNALASKLATNRFPKAPRVFNELLNRIKPSSSAVAAQNALLKRMVTNEGEERLSIEGYPAEAGLFVSVLEATGLYKKVRGQWLFQEPTSDGDANLEPIWAAAAKHLEKNASRSVSLQEIYDLWRKPPYGVRDGLMPTLAVAFVLSMKRNVAFYRDGIFQARFKDLDVEYLAKDPASVQVRWMDLSDVSRRLLSELAEVVRELDGQNRLENLEPIDVGRGLISIFDALEPWTQRTMRLSSNAIHMRTVFKKANDPNRLIFNDLPSLVGDGADVSDPAHLTSVVENVRAALGEMVNAYPEMLNRFVDSMLDELHVPNRSPQALADLRARAENIEQIGGDFRLNAFIGRLARFAGGKEEIEGLASLAANKPPHDWIDMDLDRAQLAIAELSQQFNKAEAFARVKGRRDKRQAMAVVVGVSGRPTPFMNEFDVTDADREHIDLMVSKLEEAIAQGGGGNRDLVLAALAELSTRYMMPPEEPSNSVKVKVAHHG